MQKFAAHLRSTRWAPVIALVALIGVCSPARAIEDRDPAPPATSAARTADINGDGVMTVAVLGDSLADGYWGGLYRKLAREERFEFLRYARNSTGLARPDYYDWAEALEEHLAADPIDTAVVSMGANDGQALYAGQGEWIQLGAEGWEDVYRERVEAMMQRLVDAGINTYWMGLPSVRGRHLTTSAQRLNPIYEQAAQEIGVTFVPLWELTADADGNFTSYLPDHEGRSRLMRHNDGVHFTSRGYAMIADHILMVMDQELALFDDAAAEEEATQ